MTEPTTTTFTLEVRAFPGAADQATLVSQIAQVFGIPEDAAKQIVDSAPCVVKQGAPADATRQIAKVLLDLGAELTIRNEVSGEEKVHRPTSRVNLPAAAAPTPAAPEGAGRESTAEAVARVLKSVPPPAANLPALDVCAACSRPVEKGENCASCGWHNKDQKRYCRECKRVMVVASDTTKRKLSLGVWMLLALAAAAGAFYFFGLLPSLAILALFVSPVFFYDGRSAALRCEPCKRKLEPYSLRDTERTLVGSYRRRGYLTGLLMVLLCVALAAPSVASMPEFYVESFGVGWHARLPFTHREVERLVLTMTTDAGPVRVLARRATNARLPVHTFYIMHIRLPEKDAKPIEDPSNDRWIRRSIETALGGTPKVEKSQIVTPAFGTGREAVFETTLDGKQARGRVRAFVNERNMVLVAFVGVGADAVDKPMGLSFLDSIASVTSKDTETDEFKDLPKPPAPSAPAPSK